MTQAELFIIVLLAILNLQVTRFIAIKKHQLIVEKKWGKKKPLTESEKLDKRMLKHLRK
jgi:hypothetical protein